MKKFIFFSCAVFFTAFSAKIFAQGVQQTVIINATHNYWVNSTDYATAPAGDAATNTYAWAVYDWNGTDNYAASSWTASATATTNYTGAADTDYNTQIKWLATGYYVVEVKETNTEGCTTIRRFGIQIIDLDLLVVTRDHNNTILTDTTDYCNTNEGDTWGDSNDDDLNNESLNTMTMTYEISLYTVKGSTNANDLIGTINSGNGAPWKFSAQDKSTIPTSAGGSVTWTVTDGNGTYTTGNLNEITVAAGTSTVTITAEIENIAADVANQYILDFSIDPTTVLIENGGSSATDYAEGQESASYIAGTAEPTSHKNHAEPITVNPIPNTSKISFH